MDHRWRRVIYAEIVLRRDAEAKQAVVHWSSLSETSQRYETGTGVMDVRVRFSGFRCLEVYGVLWKTSIVLSCIFIRESITTNV